jgi:vacuolar protein sorting-associated protein VTA1
VFVTGLYHAAQVGLATKPSAPAFLRPLLEVLERMKEAIGPHDAVDVDSASIAFIENFALRVFNAADEEDRRGEATRRVTVPPAFV